MKTREELLDDLARAYVEAAVSEGLANYASHTTRSSDSSLYDEVCTVCGAKDYAGGKDELSERPCRGGTDGTHPEAGFLPGQERK